MRQPWWAHSSSSLDKEITTEKHHQDVLPPIEVDRDRHGLRDGQVRVEEWEFPPFVLPTERPLLARIVAQCPEQAQLLLDELAGQVQNPARKTPIGNTLAYARTLTQRALEGRFIPEIALRIAAARQRQQAAEHAQVQQLVQRRAAEAVLRDPVQRARGDAVRAECLARIHALLSRRPQTSGAAMHREASNPCLPGRQGGRLALNSLYAARVTATTDVSLRST